MNMFGQQTVSEMVLRYRDPSQDAGVAERNRQTLMEAIDRLAAGDLDGFWSIFDPEVVFHEAACLPYGGAHVGLEATKQAFGRMGQAYSRMRAELETVAAARDVAMLYQTITFRVRDTGKTGSLPVVEMFRFREGKVVEWRAFYFDSSTVAAALAAG